MGADPGMGVFRKSMNLRCYMNFSVVRRFILLAAVSHLAICCDKKSDDRDRDQKTSQRDSNPPTNESSSTTYQVVNGGKDFEEEFMVEVDGPSIFDGVETKEDLRANLSDEYVVTLIQKACDPDYKGKIKLEIDDLTYVRVKWNFKGGAQDEDGTIVLGLPDRDLSISAKRPEEGREWDTLSCGAFDY